MEIMFGRKCEKLEKSYIVDFMMFTDHFFHPRREWILEMVDPRNPSYITYTQADLGYLGILKNICGQYSMREMEENFHTENCIDTLRMMLGNSHLQELPHYDTLNYYLGRLSPECLSDQIQLVYNRKIIIIIVRLEYDLNWLEDILCS